MFGLFSRSKPAAAVSPVPEPANDDFPPATPSPAPPDVSEQEPTQQVEVEPTAADVKDMQALVHSVPSKILHEYILDRLDRAVTEDDERKVLVMDKNTVRALLEFFVDLSPPPRVHCVRCHKGYFEVENTDTSCQLQHDDDSAEVERVGMIGKGKDRMAAYETLWGCCGNTTPGDGNMGPPDGWCYEGKHTTDAKRARFRADSSIHDDKLVTCKRCPALSAPSTTTRKRGYSSSSDANSIASSSSNPVSAENDSGLEDIIKLNKKSKIQNRGKGHSRALDREREKEKDEERQRAKKRVKRAEKLPGVDPDTSENDMDVDGPEKTKKGTSVGSGSTVVGSVKVATPRKARAKTKPVVEIPASPMLPPPSPKKKLPKPKKKMEKKDETAPRALDEIVPSSIGEEEWDYGVGGSGKKK